ncbi:discoidin domain-containing protein [Kribbella sp. NPDC049174]|uniref:PKD domain-containing protein n=1 Tax=Kribbella sp. NPDC049174 TaxID=3364112 RepID=UPI003710A99C
MQKRFATAFFVLTTAVAMVLGLAAAPALAAEGDPASSVVATWSCTSSPCPWGPSDTSNTAVWPAAAEPVRARYGYTVSHDVYAPAPKVAGWKITVTSGSATVYAGPADDSHSSLAALSAGDSYTLPSTLSSSSIVSVQDGGSFEYTITPGAPTDPPPASGDGSVLATWNCTSSPCPSGQSYTSNAGVWPAAAQPVRARYGYTVSADVYAPVSKVAGWKITVISGSATVYAGPADDSHSSLAALSAGETYTVSSTLSNSSIVSVQDDGAFRVIFTPGDPTTPPASGYGSVLATWNCTGTPCPSGTSYTSNAAVWPATAEPTRARYGYTVSHDVYAPAAKVAGWKITVTSGSAAVYAGPVGDSHSSLAALSAGESYTVSSTLSSSSIVSVQGGAAFEYTFTPGEPVTPPPAGDGESARVTWTCTSSPCPWGPSDSGYAAVWPAETDPSRARYGYTASHDVYAPAPQVANWKITVTSGSATVFSGPVGDSHASLANLSAGQSYTVPTTLSGSSIVSVQSGSPFEYAFVPGPPVPPPPSACTDPTTCDPVSWVNARWRYAGTGENPGDWYGGVITWPVGTAYQDNGRSGDNARTVYSESGVPLYPYMGAWADGCTVRVVTGRVLIVEWERGTDEWRETRVNAGQAYTISLSGSEDGAMIETDNDVEPFTVSVSNCTPRPLSESNNRLPVANAGAPQSVVAGTTVTLNGSGTDADGDDLTYAWTQTGGPAVTLSSTTAAKPTFTAPSSASTLTFSLVVRDGRANSAAATTTVTTTPANQVPVANAGTAQTVNTGTTVTLDGSGTDADGDDLTYAWTQTGGPAVTLSSTTAAKPTFTAPATPATLTFSLVVRDGKVDSAVSTTTVTVTGPNLARGKTATQSSTSGTAVAARAVDGNTNGVFASGSVTQTNTSTQPWWQVDLGSAAAVSTVTVWSRTDSNRMGSGSVFISSTDMNGRSMSSLRADDSVKEMSFSAFSSTTNSLTLNAGSATGRYVRVQLSSIFTTLNLAEVQVGGTTGAVNLSTNRPATQSSTDVGTAARAVDGNTNGVFAAGSVSRTASSSQPWWQVDLLTNSRVGNVTVHNRTDASADKLNNAVVFLSTASMSGRTYAQLMADSTVTKLNLGATPGAVTSLPTNTVARYVKVQSPVTSAGVISLAEVTVTGTQPN